MVDVPKERGQLAALVGSDRVGGGGERVIERRRGETGAVLVEHPGGNVAFAVGGEFASRGKRVAGRVEAIEEERVLAAKQGVVG